MRRKSDLRRKNYDMAELIKDDLAQMINRDGSTVTFVWYEITGGTWNPTYETWEGGTKTEFTLEQKGLGRVVDYEEDEMEYEWGRVSVGDAVIRFDVGFDIEALQDKTDLRFIYKGQKWKPDSTLGVMEYQGDTPYCKILKGAKSID